MKGPHFEGLWKFRVYICICIFVERSFEVKLRLMDRCCNRCGKSQRKDSQKQEDESAQKGRKAAKHRVFPMFWGSRGLKCRLAKAAGAEPSGGMRKLHVVVAGSTFRSQNVKSNLRSGALLAVDLLKKWTQLWHQWHEAHLGVKMLKHLNVGALLEVEFLKVHTAAARSTCQSQNVKATSASEHFCKLSCSKSALGAMRQPCSKPPAGGKKHPTVDICHVTKFRHRHYHHPSSA